MTKRKRAHPDTALFDKPAPGNVTEWFVMAFSILFIHIVTLFRLYPFDDCLGRHSQFSTPHFSFPGGFHHNPGGMESLLLGNEKCGVEN
jgi:hypothetical protein